MLKLRVGLPLREYDDKYYCVKHKEINEEGAAVTTAAHLEHMKRITDSSLIPYEANADEALQWTR